MNDKAAAGSDGWLNSAQGKVVSLTALLVVMPALVDSGIVVYNAVAKIPTNIYDKNQ